MGDLDEGDIIVYREDIEDHDGNVLADGCWSSEKWIASMENLRSRLALRQVLASDSQHHSGRGCPRKLEFLPTLPKGRQN